MAQATDATRGQTGCPSFGIGFLFVGCQFIPERFKSSSETYRGHPGPRVSVVLGTLLPGSMMYVDLHAGTNPLTSVLSPMRGSMSSSSTSKDWTWGTMLRAQGSGNDHWSL